MLKRLHIKISGRVQMVLFRDSTRRKAEDLGLVGWIKNVSDGSVESVAEGEEEKLKKFLKWCHKGPFLAKVENIEEEWLDFKDEFDDFKIVY